MQLLGPIHTEMMSRRAMVSEWIASEERLEWVPPDGGVVCLPHIRDASESKIRKFHEELTAKHGAYVGAGHWFEMSDAFFRLGYGWPSRAELAAGLDAISVALRT